MSEIWSSIVKSLEGKLDPKELKTWFAPTRQVSRPLTMYDCSSMATIEPTP